VQNYLFFIIFLTALQQFGIAQILTVEERWGRCRITPFCSLENEAQYFDISGKNML